MRRRLRYTHGLFTISIEGEPTSRFPKGRLLRFYALPKSFKAAGKTADGKNPDIEVTGRLTYGI